MRCGPFAQIKLYRQNIDLEWIIEANISSMDGNERSTKIIQRIVLDFN